MQTDSTPSVPVGLIHRPLNITCWAEFGDLEEGSHSRRFVVRILACC